jgi:hypothetical protein
VPDFERVLVGKPRVGRPFKPSRPPVALPGPGRCPRGHIRLVTDTGCPVCDVEDGRRLGWVLLAAPPTPRPPVRLEPPAPAMTYCAQGHPWIPENIAPNGGARTCRMCKNARKRADYARSVA